MTLFKRVLDLLKERKMEIPIIIGGIIPEDDIPKLKEMGIDEVFLPGTPLKNIVAWTIKNITPRY